MVSYFERTNFRTGVGEEIRRSFPPLDGHGPENSLVNFPTGRNRVALPFVINSSDKRQDE